VWGDYTNTVHAPTPYAVRTPATYMEPCPSVESRHAARGVPAFSNSARGTRSAASWIRHVAESAAVAVGAALGPLVRHQRGDVRALREAAAAAGSMDRACAEMVERFMSAGDHEHPPGSGVRLPRALQRANLVAADVRRLHLFRGRCQSLLTSAATRIRRPRALQRPKSASVRCTQDHRVLGICCGSPTRAPGRLRAYHVPDRSADIPVRLGCVRPFERTGMSALLLGKVWSVICLR
jgi:hypothetical protein